MTKFVSPTHKSLRVYDLGVQFVDGEVEVSDPETVAKLRAATDRLGITEVVGDVSEPAKAPVVVEDEPEAKPAPKPRAKRAAAESE